MPNARNGETLRPRGGRVLRIIAPTAWLVASIGGYYHPGDEYGCWLVGSIAGLWPLLFVQVGSSPGDAVPFCLAIGGVTMFLFGWAMDAVRVRWHWFAAGWLALASVVTLTSIGSHPTVARAISKNGSIATYVFMGSNLGIYLTTVGALLVALPYRLLRRRRRPQDCRQCGYDLTLNTSARCPECGNPTGTEPASAP